MINASGEINALLNLIEDPDEEIFQTVKQRFLDFGNEVIPYLEEYKESNTDEEQQRKIDHIISSISLSTLSSSISAWKENEDEDILEASAILSVYLNNEFDREEFLFEIEKLRKSIWLELNDYLTPLEEINVINRIIFGYYQYKGLETDHSQLKQFDIFQLLHDKKSNTFPLGALYLAMAHMLGVPVKPVALPKQNLLAYIEDPSPFDKEQIEKILFFIDPFNGQIFTHRDIDIYLKKINAGLSPRSIKATSNQTYLYQWIRELAVCEKEKGNDGHYNELHNIASMLIGE